MHAVLCYSIQDRIIFVPIPFGLSNALHVDCGLLILHFLIAVQKANEYKNGKERVCDNIENGILYLFMHLV